MVETIRPNPAEDMTNQEISETFTEMTKPMAELHNLSGGKKLPETGENLRLPEVPREEVQADTTDSAKTEMQESSNERPVGAVRGKMGENYRQKISTPELERVGSRENLSENHGANLVGREALKAMGADMKQIVELSEAPPPPEQVDKM